MSGTSDYPVCFPNALPDALFGRVCEEVSYQPWDFNNMDYDNTYISWSKSDNFPLVYFQAAIHLKYTIQRRIKNHLRLVKIHSNGQTSGQLSSFHQDTTLDNIWTCVLFTNASWNVNHGGEFTLFDPVEKTYRSSSYMPNTAVLFPSNWDHRGAPPLVPEAKLRTSLAFMYCYSSHVENTLLVHPQFKKFL